MTEKVTSRNLVGGPAEIYYGDYSATEPADAAVNSAPATSAWTYVGATEGGLTIQIKQTVATRSVDQVRHAVEGRITDEEISFGTTLSEATLDNLALALNDATVTPGSGYKTLDPATAVSSTGPYKALLIDGPGPAAADGTAQRRRVIVRKVLSVDAVKLDQDKKNPLAIPVTWQAFHVSDSIAPYHVVDEDAA